MTKGGYFLNCSNNFKYVKQFPNLNFFVDPVPHDGGTAIGACIYYENYNCIFNIINFSVFNSNFYQLI